MFLDIAAGTLIVRDQATSAVTRSHPISTITVAAPCSTTCFGFISDPVPGVDPAGHTMCHVFDGLGSASRILEAISAQITMLAQVASPTVTPSQPSTSQTQMLAMPSPSKVQGIGVWGFSSHSRRGKSQALLLHPGEMTPLPCHLSHQGV